MRYFALRWLILSLAKELCWHSIQVQNKVQYNMFICWALYLYGGNNYIGGKPSPFIGFYEPHTHLQGFIPSYSLVWLIGKQSLSSTSWGCAWLLFCRYCAIQSFSCSTWIQQLKVLGLEALQYNAVNCMHAFFRMNLKSLVWFNFVLFWSIWTYDFILLV